MEKDLIALFVVLELNLMLIESQIQKKLKILLINFMKLKYLFRGVLIRIQHAIIFGFTITVQVG